MDKARARVLVRREGVAGMEGERGETGEEGAGAGRSGAMRAGFGFIQDPWKTSGYFKQKDAMT